MVYDIIRREFEEMISRLLNSSLCVKQNSPSSKTSNNIIELGRINALKETGAMKNIPYKDIYDSLVDRNAYHIQLIDGSLLTLQYRFDQYSKKIIKHRLSFHPSPKLPEYDRSYSEYIIDDLYLDAQKENLVKFPIRFDYDPEAASSPHHPASHMTLGQYENCRIPVNMPVTPRKFILFIVRNFYYLGYKRNKNTFDKRIKPTSSEESILTKEEKKISHIIL